MNISNKLEAILFAAGKPFSIKRLAELVSASAEETNDGLKELGASLDERGSAVMLQTHGHDMELVTRPDVSEIVKQVASFEASGELTRPSLEALTILAYRGPMTRPELEQVRGVQSSMILRNLMMRGLVEEKEDTRLGQPIYAVTFEFLNALGLPSVDALPEYDALRGHAAIQDVLADLEQSPEPHA